MKKRIMLCAVAYFLCTSVFVGASAYPNERWTSQIPEPIASLYDESEWAGYGCIDGFAYYPVKEVSETHSSNVAYLIMQKDESYVFCILEQEYDEWKWRVNAKNVLPYYDDVIPFLVPLDDMAWTWVDYDLPDGYRESFCFIRPDGMNWFLKDYYKYIPETPVRQSFYISVDANKHFDLFFDLYKQYDGNREKMIRAFGEMTDDYREFFVTVLENGEYLYNEQPFYGILDLDLNRIDIESFPRTMEEVLDQLSPEPINNK